MGKKESCVECGQTLDSKRYCTDAWCSNGKPGAVLRAYSDQQLQELSWDVICLVDGTPVWRFDEQQADPIHKKVDPQEVYDEVRRREKLRLRKFRMKKKTKTIKPLTEGKTKSLTKKLNKSKRPVKGPPAPQPKGLKKGQVVSIKCDGYGLTSFEEGKVLKTDKEGVWLDNGSGNDPTGPFDPETGKDTRAAIFGLAISIVFDNGKAYREYEEMNDE